MNFPFTMPELPILTASTSFRQGIENPIHSNAPQNAPTAGWWAGDNGFDSTGAMIDCHAPLLRLAGSYLRAAGGGRVLDLGCGNGVFLQALCHDNSAIAPFGVDLNAAAIQHAREAVLPEFAANFMQADMFDCDSIWPPGRVYSLAVVMPGRLVEIDADRAARLRQHLSNSCDRILLYAYGDWLTRVGSLAELAAAAGFQVQLDEAIQSPGVSAAFATPQASVPTPTAAFNPRQATHSPVSAAESQSIALSDIDWLRMARPQADQYDTAATLAVARELGHSRPPTQSVLVSASRFFDGAIEIRTGKKTWFGETYGVADRCHPNVQRASELVSVWPEAYAQFKALIHCVYLYTDDTAADDYIVGSTCGAGPDGFGSIAATVNHHVGFGEALVHEMAHHKLRGLGVDFESARRLITNSQESRFPSPIRHDCLRPMTAVVHAQYSYMYIAELDLQIVTMTSERERNRAVVERSLAVIVPKLSFGASVIRANAQTDDAGVRFLQGLFSWYEDLLSRAAQVFRDFAVEPAQFRHPLEAG